MQGDGRYNRNSTAQAAAGDRGVPLLVEAAEAVPFPPGAFASARGPVVLADYGCSEGRNSLMPIGAAVDALRARHGNDLQVLVLHTDLPGNDYSSLFGTLADDPLTYQRPGVFPVAAGRSYFEPARADRHGRAGLELDCAALAQCAAWAPDGHLAAPGSDIRAGCLAVARSRGLGSVPVRRVEPSSSLEDDWLSYAGPRRHTAAVVPSG